MESLKQYYLQDVEERSIKNIIATGSGALPDKQVAM